MGVAGTAFASDFDGTLCQSNWDTGEEVFDPAVLAAVRRYQEAGGLFGICTGRPLFAVLGSVKDKVDLDFYIVTTGAQVLDRNLRTLFDREIDRDLIAELYERYASEELLMVALTEKAFVSVGRPMSPRLPLVGSLDEVEGRVLGVSFECHDNEPLARRVCDDMNARYAGRIEGFQNLGSVDVVPPGCSKGSGVHMAKEVLGVSCMAGAGDSYNDLPLLTAADVSYTFASSPAEVRDAATYVVRDLAEALDDFMSRSQ